MGMTTQPALHAKYPSPTAKLSAMFACLCMDNRKELLAFLHTKAAGSGVSAIVGAAALFTDGVTPARAVDLPRIPSIHHPLSRKRSSEGGASLPKLA